MFKQLGQVRTFSHNLQIASFLSFVAGIVNVVGFLSVYKLTTNVTGHFAYFIREVYQQEWAVAIFCILYIFFFFLGSFISNLLVELISRRSDKFKYVVPAFLEASILFVVGMEGWLWIENHPDIIAFALLFAMGMQNSLVTTISHSVIRTTHLTGLFTDLGIEISQLFFYKTKEHKKQLLTNIGLRFTIIGSFFLGGIVAGLSYSSLGMKTLYIACGILMFEIFYDIIKFNIIMIRRKIRSIADNVTN